MVSVGNNAGEESGRCVVNECDPISMDRKVKVREACSSSSMRLLRDMLSFNETLVLICTGNENDKKLRRIGKGR